MKNLAKRGKITSSSDTALSKIWEERDDFHHLNPSVETDRRKLSSLVQEKAQLLDFLNLVRCPNCSFQKRPTCFIGSDDMRSSRRTSV